MIALLASWLAPIVGQKFAKAAAWAAIIIVAIPTLLLLKTCYDNSVIDNAVNEANAEFGEEKDKTIGEADVESDARKAEHDARVKTTQELTDEALEKGCALGEYLASRGAKCLR
jgi:hypothetical protein